MKILITGGAGFVGSSLAKSLANDGHTVFLIDNLSTGSIENLARLNSFTFFEVDLSDKNTIIEVEPIIKSVDMIFHFAASIGVKLINDNPNETFKNSNAINDNLFPLFEKYNKKVIYSSTSEIYGETLISGVSETANMCVQNCPRGSYAASKIYAEFMLKSYNFPYVITRFFNVVGPNQTSQYGHVLPKFIECAKENKDLPVNGTGGQVRSYCDIRDAVEMLKLLMDDEHNGETYNIGSSKNVFSLNKLASIVIGKLNSTSKIEYKEIRPEFGEIYIRVPKMDKMDKYYKSKYSIEDIIDYIGENK